MRVMKYISFFAIVSFLWISFSFAEPPTADQIVKYLKGEIKLSDEEKKNADLNKDNKIDQADVYLRMQVENSARKEKAQEIATCPEQKDLTKCPAVDVLADALQVSKTNELINKFLKLDASDFAGASPRFQVREEIILDLSGFKVEGSLHPQGMVKIGDYL